MRFSLFSLSLLTSRAGCRNGLTRLRVNSVYQ
jgi:hypothetical protein